MNQTQIPNQFAFSVRQLAEIFGTSYQHWINLIESGQIDAIDLRNPTATKSMWRIQRDELLRFLNTAKTL